MVEASVRSLRRPAADLWSRGMRAVVARVLMPGVLMMLAAGSPAPAAPVADPGQLEVLSSQAAGTSAIQGIRPLAETQDAAPGAPGRLSGGGHLGDGRGDIQAGDIQGIRPLVDPQDPSLRSLRGGGREGEARRYIGGGAMTALTRSLPSPAELAYNLRLLVLEQGRCSADQARELVVLGVHAHPESAVGRSGAQEYHRLTVWADWGSCGPGMTSSAAAEIAPTASPTASIEVYRLTDGDWFLPMVGRRLVSR